MIQNMVVIKEDYINDLYVFDKKSTSLNKYKGSGISNKPNYELANELLKPIIKKF